MASPQTRDMLCRLLTEPEGFGIELFDQLGTARLGDGTFAVWYDDSDDHNIEEFNEVGKAVDRFLEIREQRELGYDYEVQGRPK